MQEIQYEAPRSIADAVRALAGPAACVLAGGTDLLVRMRAEPPRAQRIVDVKAIPELRTIALDAEGLRLGAAVPCREVSQHADLKRLFPGLVEAAELIGSMQIQSRASLGGNLCNASPAADTVPALIALGAQCEIAGPHGSREVAVESFVTGPGETVLQAGEFLVALRVPTPPPRSRDAYLRFTPRGEMDIAVVGAGVSVTLDDAGVCRAARIVLGAVAPTPRVVPEAAEALLGTAVDEAALARAGAAAMAAADPIDDKRGTASYRRKLAGVLTRRAASIAARRAREGDSR
jgi:carbon-monoxide dehydrogenase medium subunit